MKKTLKTIGFTIVKTRNTFGFWGKLAWELDRTTDGKIGSKIILMPFLKAFAHFDLMVPPKYTGDGFFVLATKLPMSKKGEEMMVDKD